MFFLHFVPVAVDVQYMLFFDFEPVGVHVLSRNCADRHACCFLALCMEVFLLFIDIAPLDTCVLLYALFLSGPFVPTAVHRHLFLCLNGSSFYFNDRIVHEYCHKSKLT